MKHIMLGFLTPKVSNVYSTRNQQCTTPKESNVYSKRNQQSTTPKESNVYSKFRFNLTYDSFGVARGIECRNFYKHAIPSGLF
jgi:hypothetical protein